MSSTSSTICVSDVAFRSIVSIAFVLLVGGHDAGAQHARVAEDRIQRRPQLVREAGEKVVLDAAGLLHARVHPGVFERDRGPRRDADREPLMMLGEAPDAGVAEEQSADDVPRPALDRHGEIAAHRQVSRGHPVVRGVVAVARILRDVSTPDHGGSLEGRLEHLGVARHRKLREGLARHARNRVQRVRLAALIHQVIEERAELGRRQFRRRVGDGLDHLVPVQIGRDDGADVCSAFP